MATKTNKMLDRITDERLSSFLKLFEISDEEYYQAKDEAYEWWRSLDAASKNKSDPKTTSKNKSDPKTTSKNKSDPKTTRKT